MKEINDLHLRWGGGRCKPECMIPPCFRWDAPGPRDSGRRVCVKAVRGCEEFAVKVLERPLLPCK